MCDLPEVLAGNTAALHDRLHGTSDRYMLGIAEEAGEVIGAYNKYKDGRQDKLKRPSDIIIEMAQLMGCIFLAADKWGYLPEELLTMANDFMYNKAKPLV